MKRHLIFSLVLLAGAVSFWSVGVRALRANEEEPQAKDVIKLKHIEEQVEQILQVQEQLAQRFTELSEEFRIVKVRTSR